MSQEIDADRGGSTATDRNAYQAAMLPEPETAKNARV